MSTRGMLLGCLLSALICAQHRVFAQVIALPPIPLPPPRDPPPEGGVSCCIDMSPLCTSTPRCAGHPCELNKCPKYPDAKCRWKPCSCDAQFYVIKDNAVEHLTDCLDVPLPPPPPLQIVGRK